MKFFQHYKGGLYQVLLEAKTEKDGVDVVIYRGKNGKNFVRPASEFYALVEHPDTKQEVPRFTEIEPLSEIALQQLETLYNQNSDKFTTQLVKYWPSIRARLRGAR
jgi:hypothetical protein